MPGHPTQWYLRAVELLEDGEWHDYKQVVREAAKVIPPGKALRRNEQMRQAAVRRPGEHLTYTAERRVIARSHEELISIGAQAIVRATLSGSATFEIEPRGTKTADGLKRVRLRPGQTVWRPPDG